MREGAPPGVGVAAIGCLFILVLPSSLTTTRGRPLETSCNAVTSSSPPAVEPGLEFGDMVGQLRPESYVVAAPEGGVGAEFEAGFNAPAAVPPGNADGEPPGRESA